MYARIPEDARLAIMRAYLALPPGAIVLFASVRNLFERPPGIVRAEAADQAVRFSHMRRAAMGGALLASAMGGAMSGAGAGGAASCFERECDQD
jgi:hypothetical protein